MNCHVGFVRRTDNQEKKDLLEVAFSYFTLNGTNVLHTFAMKNKLSVPLIAFSLKNENV